MKSKGVAKVLDGILEEVVGPTISVPTSKQQAILDREDALRIIAKTPYFDLAATVYNVCRSIYGNSQIPRYDRFKVVVSKVCEYEREHLGLKDLDIEEFLNLFIIVFVLVYKQKKESYHTSSYMRTPGQLYLTLYPDLARWISSPGSRVYHLEEIIFNYKAPYVYPATWIVDFPEEYALKLSHEL